MREIRHKQRLSLDEYVTPLHLRIQLQFFCRGLLLLLLTSWLLSHKATHTIKAQQTTKPGTKKELRIGSIPTVTPSEINLQNAHDSARAAAAHERTTMSSSNTPLPAPPATWKKTGDPLLSNTTSALQMASTSIWSTFCSLSCPPDAASSAVSQIIALLSSAALKQV